MDLTNLDRSGLSSSLTGLSGAELRAADCAQFRLLSRMICDFLSKHGVNAVPFESEDLLIFSSIDPDVRRDVLERLRAWSEVLVAFPDFDIWSTELQVLWRTLQRSGFRFPADLFDRLTQESVVEVYTKDNRQIFRSLQFFKVCSYTLEQVYSLPWYSLYSRPEEIGSASIELYNRLCSGEVKSLVFKPFVNHTVTECLPGYARTTAIESRLISPLFDRNGAFQGFLNSFDIRPTHDC